MRVLTAALLATLSGAAMASTDEIPLTEHEFVARIKTADKAQIIEHLGEPARAIDVKDDETGEVMGAIWHYYYLNTSESGEYYKTTELDFVGDKVITVVFSTHDGEDGGEATVRPEPEIIQQ
jgi:hypothetical protein